MLHIFHEKNIITYLSTSWRCDDTDSLYIFFTENMSLFILYNQQWDCWGPFYLHGLTLNWTWISNYIHYEVWDEITYPFWNFNGATVEV